MRVSISYPPIPRIKGTSMISQNPKSPSSETGRMIMRNFKGEKNPFYGRKHSDESKRRMLLSHKGQIPWNKGKVGVYSEETLLKMKRPKSREHRRRLSLSRFEKFRKIAGEKILEFNHDINVDGAKRIAFGEILGTIPSDGYLGFTENDLVSYMLASKDKEFVERISKAFAKFGVQTEVHRRNAGLWYIEVSRRWFDGFLPYLEKEDDNWIYSERVLNSPFKDFKAAIIRSFADAEGTVTCTVKDGRYYSRHIAIYNKSQKLLSQIRAMLSSFGIVSHIHLSRHARVTNIGRQTVNFPTVYNLAISNHRNLDLFYKSIGFGISRKMEKLREMLISYRAIERQYTLADYEKAISLYNRVKNCREVSRQLNIPPQTVQNWILLGVKPRLVKISEASL
ncbi:MAG: LAGLIDADG family homing endonuclease [Thermoproteota archaeon]